MSVDIKEALAFFDPMRVESVLDLSEWRALVDIVEAARRVAEADEVLREYHHHHQGDSVHFTKGERTLHYHLAYDVPMEGTCLDDACPFAMVPGRLLLPAEEEK